MATNVSVIKINAPVNKVWEALTKPELVKKWQYGSELITDWNVGSTIRFRAEWEGKVFEQCGIILEVVQHKVIRYSLFAPRPDLEDKPENYFMMNYTLTEGENQVTLEIIQEDNRPGARQSEQQGEENPILNGLKLLIESL
jgi:uncharacterized protein YndB with AHSA1/START domain